MRIKGFENKTIDIVIFLRYSIFNKNHLTMKYTYIENVKYVLLSENSYDMRIATTRNFILYIIFNVLLLAIWLSILVISYISSPEDSQVVAPIIVGALSLLILFVIFALIDDMLIYRVLTDEQTKKYELFKINYDKELKSRQAHEACNPKISQVSNNSIRITGGGRGFGSVFYSSGGSGRG